MQKVRSFFNQTMAGYIIKRFFRSLLVVFLVITILFALIKLLPSTICGDKMTAQQCTDLETSYGLRDSLPTQYSRFIGGVLQGDLGTSIKVDKNQPINTLLASRLPVSATLAILPLIFGTIVGIVLGVIGALNRNKWPDYVVNIVAVIFTAVPSFIFAGLLQYLFSSVFRVFPTLYKSGDFSSYILPMLAMSLVVVATLTRYIRSEMIEVMNSDYVLLARAKGVKQRDILFKHALRNALIPAITVLGTLALGLLTGTLVIETIFSIPGMGKLMVQGLQTGDQPVVLAMALVLSFLFSMTLLVVDVLYSLVDPRIRLGGK